MNILHVVGARPNFMKVAPVIKALEDKNGINQVLVHTGQHYDINMSDIFFSQLGIPEPDINLEVGSASHAVQTAQIMIGIEAVLLEKKPDLVLVYGDVNSTIAAVLVCAKSHIPVGHVEAGLRSFDRSMPEEINRIVTDQIADLLFTPSADGDENLLHEGIAPGKIHLVGNVMIDTLVELLPRAKELWPALQKEYNLTPDRFGLITLHRPSNVDDPAMLSCIVQTLHEIARHIPLVFPIHPRTLRCMQDSGLQQDSPGIRIVEPLGYLDFLAAQANASFVITDSGGIQEETTYLGIPCLTVRENTERPVTVNLGTNTLIGRDMERLRNCVMDILDGHGKSGVVPQFWDGKASERIADIVMSQ